MSPTARHDAPRDLGLCLAGGGNRSFWQVGLLETWGARVLPRVAALSACSAGACMAVLLASDTVEPARAAFASLRRGIDRNFDPRKLLWGERALPHEHVYRTTLARAIDDAAFARLKSAPYPIWLLGAEPPERLHPVLSVALGLSAYQLEKLARPRSLHPTVAPKVGFRAHLHDARECASIADLIDLVLASSASPPITRVGRYGGARLLDGSLVDNAPAFALDGAPGVKRSLVLLTRPYASTAIGRRGDRLYLAPTEPVPAHRWDYRESSPVDATVELGRRDAKRHGDALEAFLALA